MNKSSYFFFILILFLGAPIVGDYGISMDEPIERKHGIVAFDYLNEKFNLFPGIEKGTGENLNTYDHRDYGMIFQLAAYGLELLLGINNSRDVFLLRHLLVFILFWSSLVFFYKIIVWQYKDWRIGILGVLFFLLSPRLFAESFYNPKDIPIMAFFIISTYTLIRFLYQNTKSNAVWHGIACGLAISTRIVGIILPVFTLILVLFKIFEARWVGLQWKSFISGTVIFLFSVLLATFLFWPVLWENPVDSFLYSFNSMKKFRWYGNILLWGELVNSNALPWHYIPSWILVTTPLSFIVFFITGIFSMVRSFLKDKKAFLFDQKNKADIIYLGLFLGPLFSVILFNSVLYNGWRHLYFIYPFFLLIGMRGFLTLFLFVKRSFTENKQILVSGVLSFIIVFNLIQTLVFMIRFHPHQNVYFNELARNVEHNFERDYYGLSYRQALKYLLENTEDDSLMIYSHDFIGKINTMNFPKKEADRLRFVSNQKDADYFISLLNPRNEKEYDDMIKKKSPYNNPEFVNIQVNGYRIISIFKLNVGDQ
ncbi:ArnT family glycosyltransferase [Aquiflexum sp.]|uniref:ArnT family glycosyltransferase n=1 Tax=Aquiflexum sp. TaxID=1872584 RepID=UPI0035930C79